MQLRSVEIHGTVVNVFASFVEFILCGSKLVHCRSAQSEQASVAGNAHHETLHVGARMSFIVQWKHRNSLFHTIVVQGIEQELVREMYSARQNDYIKYLFLFFKTNLHFTYTIVVLK